MVEVLKCQELNLILLWFSQECVKIKLQIKKDPKVHQNKKMEQKERESYLLKDKSLKLDLRDTCKRNLLMINSLSFLLQV